MKIAATSLDMIKLLVLKDWQIYQKQLAGYVAGMLLALSLVGTAKASAFSAGALLLLVLLIAMGTFLIQTTLLTERKEQTVPFVMSLPISPREFYWGKLLSNLAIYLVPFSLITIGTVVLVLSTALPDGLLVYSLLIYMFMLMCFCLTLCIAIAIESEGWIVFTMLSLMTLVGPYIIKIGQLKTVGPYIKTDQIVLAGATPAILAAELSVIVLAIAITSWVHARKTSFL